MVHLGQWVRDECSGGATTLRGRRGEIGAALLGAVEGDLLTVAGAVDVDADGVHGEAVEDGGGERGVAEVLAPGAQLLGWEDECSRTFAPRQLQEMKSAVSNDNVAPEGNNPDGDPEHRPGDVSDDEEAEGARLAIDRGQADRGGPSWKNTATGRRR